jgi:Cu-Zn family superoxide dismutase
MTIDIRITLVAATMTLMAACSAPPPREEATPTAPAVAPAELVPVSTAQEATVNLASASASLVSGKLTLVPMGDGINIIGEVGGLKPGSAHGFHVHQTGDCNAVDASSAGSHFNPMGTQHGRAGIDPHHAGDIDNIVADADGVAKVDVHLSGVTLGGDGFNDIAGRAFIIHASPDDYASQPAGNAGARVACGVIKVTK